MTAVLCLLLGCLATPSLSLQFSLPFCADKAGCHHPHELQPKPIDGRNKTRSDISFPLIGLGTAALRDQTSNLIVEAVREYGYALIDTAQASEWYREEGVGDGLAALRASQYITDHVVVVTKIHPRSYR